MSVTNKCKTKTVPTTKQQVQKQWQNDSITAKYTRSYAKPYYQSHDAVMMCDCFWIASVTALRINDIT